MKPVKSEKYKKFIRSQPCFICGLPFSQHHHESLSGGTMAGKCPDFESLPLCPTCHHERHQIGRTTFFEQYGVDYRLEIAKLNQKFEAKHETRN